MPLLILFNDQFSGPGSAVAVYARERSNEMSFDLDICHVTNILGQVRRSRS